MARRLKVFCWSDGLTAHTIAASSRAKALAAWGFHRDLFKDGEAREVEGGPDYDAALAAPGETIRRDLARPPSPHTGRATRVAQRRAAQRARLEQIEASITEVTEEERAADGEIAREREALARKEARLAQRLRARRDALEDKRDEVRARLRR